MISGCTREVIGRQGVLDEGINFLPRPITAHALLARIHAVLDER
jgi:hypothetical protein